MIKHYLVPYAGDGLTVSTAFRPKYLKELGVHFSAIDFPDKDMFLVVVNTEDSKKIQDLESNSDVISLGTNNIATRLKLRTNKNIDLAAGDDLVEKIGRLKLSSFKRGDFGINTQ